MSNLYVNRLSAVLSVAEIARITAGLADVQQTMPFLLGLTENERRQLPMIRKSNKLFVDEAVRLVGDNQTLLPGYINPLEMGKDLSLHDQLLEIERMLEQLLEKVRHTRMLAGSEAYVAALLFYEMAKSAAARGIAGSDTVAKRLGERFVRHGRNGAGSNEPELEADSTMETPDSDD